MLHQSEQFGLQLTQSQHDAFNRYQHELVAWNKHTNLTRITDPAEIITKHFLDSFSLYPLLSQLSRPYRLIDVGTGAGFPGLPLKIAHPPIKLTLLESTRKKTDFLQHVVKTLALEDVKVVTSRAEEAGQQSDHRALYDVAVARAVASLSVLAEYMLPFVKEGGLVMAQKGQDPTAEIETAQPALAILGAEVDQVLPIAIPGLDAERHIVVLRKNHPTPAIYPRRVGVPTKRPLS
ncbi:MAG: 16S rRNA (guanine(527)-N(7))-methyltransferase RsmG [Chloroflexota bacterium]